MTTAEAARLLLGWDELLLLKGLRLIYGKNRPE
jgi:hypothetical protein